MSNDDDGDITQSIAIHLTRFNDIESWMHRVRDTSQRPLPMLVVSGPVGAGKTVGVRSAARHAKVRLVEIGSSSSGDSNRAASFRWVSTSASLTE